ncbi:MAG: UDP-N-acetylglucosamine 1-carboxyvinyltransferase [Oscillospiraceae bacterium]|nr:UDP-N-acetylglucosamine 1-carboxyvinyltransferase [Oscillospiraceae bacterium]
MSVLKISGGRELRGTARVHGAKNSVLPIIAASLLANGETVLHNCPKLSDVDAAIKILRHLGCSAERAGNEVIIDSRGLSRLDIPHGLMREMRSSVIFLGAMLARGGEAELSLPGGCELGPRPIDLHLGALRELGAEITEEGGSIICRAAKLWGRRVNLSFPSVGATENTMLAASLADGTTIITNAAREPEIWDLQCYLRALGVAVYGAGTPTVTVEGTKISASVSHSVIPDRIVAATYLAAAAATRSEIELTDVIPAHLSTVIEVLGEMGCDIRVERERIRVSSDGKLRAVRPIITGPYPGFPTDAQPQLMAAALKARGTTAFVENIFDNRYRHVGEMRRLGADIKLEGRVAMVTGARKLHGAPVTATDLRGGAALVVAALGAEGVTEISGVHHIDRGYDGLEDTLRAVGAKIERV